MGSLLNLGFKLNITILYSIAPFMFYMIIVKNLKNLEAKKLQEKIGEIYVNFKFNSRQALFYNYYFMLRRLLLAIAIVFAENL